MVDSDLDRPIFRIYGFDRFKDLLASRQDGLRNPTLWDDPYENFLLARTEVFDQPSGTYVPLCNLAESWFGQCWSLNEETDAMWRIYSPDPKASLGVKVKTTIRRLFDNLQNVRCTAPRLQFFVGEVAYLDEAEIAGIMAGMTFAAAVSGGAGAMFSQLLCIKRNAFAHEKEIRILYDNLDGASPPLSGTFLYPLDPAHMFDEVVLDPRLNDHDAVTRGKELEAAGCTTIPVRRSDLYQAPAYRIPMD